MSDETPNNLNRDKLDTYLAEYNTLRAEQLERINFQNQAFNYLLLVLGAAISAVVALIGKPELSPTVFWIILLLPIVCAQIGYLFFDHELAIHSIGSHLYHHLRPSIEEIVKSEEKILNNSLEFRYLHKSSTKIHQRLSQSRWFLFLVPTVIPVLGSVVFTFLYWKWWEKLNPAPTNLLLVICVIVWVVDFAATFLLVQAVIWTYVKLDRSDRSTGKILWMNARQNLTDNLRLSRSNIEIPEADETATTEENETASNK